MISCGVGDADSRFKNPTTPRLKAVETESGCPIGCRKPDLARWPAPAALRNLFLSMRNAGRPLTIRETPPDPPSAWPLREADAAGITVSVTVKAPPVAAPGSGESGRHGRRPCCLD
jgi:hypothetical protein